MLQPTAPDQSAQLEEQGHADVQGCVPEHSAIHREAVIHLLNMLVKYGKFQAIVVNFRVH